MRPWYLKIKKAMNFNQIELDSPAVGFVNGIEVDELYQWVLDISGPKPILIVQRSFDGADTWQDCTQMSQWYLETLQKSTSDGLSIDFGKGWYVVGRTSAVMEATDLVSRIQRADSH